MKLFLIRHGEMAGDPFCRPARPVTGCLSAANGVPQAEAARDRLAAERLDFALASPYGRALQTAEIVMAGRPADIRIIDSLHEWLPNPALDELPSDRYEEIQNRAANFYAEETWKTDLGEGYYDMCARVVPAVLKALDELGVHHRHGGYVLDDEVCAAGIAVFAHGGSLSVLLAHLLELRPFPFSRFKFGLACVVTLEFAECRGIWYPQLVFPTSR